MTNLNLFQKDRIAWGIFWLSAFLVRFIGMMETPPLMNQDSARVALDAYMILETGTNLANLTPPILTNIFNG